MTGERVLWVAVAASYGAFAVFVIAAMSRGTMIGSCGCFGRDETPPHLLHVVLDAALATVAIVAAVRATSPIDAIVDEPGAGAVVSGLVALTLYLLYLAFVELPRLLVARAPHVH